MLNLYDFVGTADYYLLGAAAFWGVFCIIILWQRVGGKRFRSEDVQNKFLDEIDSYMKAGDLDSVKEMCSGDSRAVPRMIELAIENKDWEIEELEGMVMDRFQADVLSEFDARLNWVSTLIKASPMLGLIGTVAGMMGAFETLETATTSDPTKQLLADIRMALEHTLIGLLITVTLLVTVAFITNRIQKLEELVAFGMNRFFKSLRAYKESSRQQLKKRFS